MSLFEVRTWETVEGVYLVEADNVNHARAKLDTTPSSIDWKGVEQIDYQAFEIEVRSVDEQDSP